MLLSFWRSLIAVVEPNRVCISLPAINYMFGLSQPVPTCPICFLTFSPNDLYIYMGFLVIRLGQLGQLRLVNIFKPLKRPNLVYEVGSGWDTGSKILIFFPSTRR